MVVKGSWEEIMDRASLKYLSRADEEILIARAKDGDRRAEDEIIVANLRYIATIVGWYTRRTSDDYWDVFNCGVAGFVHGIRTYKIGSENGLRVYAKWWVRSRCQTFINNTCPGVIHVPRSIIEKRNALLARIEEAKSRGVSPDQDTIAELSSIYVYAESTTLSYDGLQSAYGDLFEPHVHEHNEDLATREMRDALHSMFKAAKLNARTIETLSCYYGLNRETPLTVEAISKKFGCSRQRVGQVLNNAREKLRALNRCSHSSFKLAEVFDVV